MKGPPFAVGRRAAILGRISDHSSVPPPHRLSVSSPSAPPSLRLSRSPHFLVRSSHYLSSDLTVSPFLGSGHHREPKQGGSHVPLATRSDRAPGIRCVCPEHSLHRLPASVTQEFGGAG